MAGEAPHYSFEDGRLKRWLSETPDAKLCLHMLLAASVIVGLLLLIDISFFN